MLKNKKETEKESTVTDNEISDTDNILNDSKNMECDSSTDEETALTEVNTSMIVDEAEKEGLEACRHAPNSQHMHIDTRDALLDATKTRTTTQRRFQLPTSDSMRLARAPNVSGFALNLGRASTSNGLSKRQQQPPSQRQ
ncbi:hypothetical protein [Absidia glauca]|uniref:Uncharacterized protein n=1 Tax=Absidia glauca TaxID=4829 RepID=A0A168PVB3_ABSGL|nr:hypothetical protein [Absidia glauca]